MDYQQYKEMQYDLPAIQRKEDMVNNPFLSDVSFLVGKKKQKIYAHKLFLIVASEYFNKMFTGDFKEASCNEVNAEDIEPEIFLAILKFIYCGIIDLTPDNGFEIYVHSQKYLMKDLMELSSNFLEDNINSKNVLSIFSQNRLYGFPFIDAKCLDEISTNPLYYFKQDEFYALGSDSLESIFNSDKINCSDNDLFNALSVWWENGDKTEDLADLDSRLIKRRRVCKCHNLRFFGKPIKIAPDDPAPFKFSLQIESMKIYGLGIFVDCSSGTPVDIKIIIKQDGDQLGKTIDHRYCASNPVENVAEIYFEELILFPQKVYEILVIYERSQPVFGIWNKYCAFKMVKRIGYQRAGTLYNSLISHFLYDCKKEMMNVSSSSSESDWNDTDMEFHQPNNFN